MGRLTEIANQIESPGATSEAGTVTMPSGETVAIKPASIDIEDALAIPDFCKMSPEARKAAWAAYDLKNPKPVAATTETTKMKPKTGKADQLRAMREAEAAKREAEAKRASKNSPKKMETAVTTSDTHVTPSKPEEEPKAEQQESSMSSRKTNKAAKAKARSAVKGKTKAKAPKKAKAEKTARSGSKTEVIKGLLSRAAGCTAADVMEATGWPSVSMPQQARNLGIKLKTEKEGRVTRYWAA